VNFAKNAGYEFGLSWKEQLENRSIFLSSADGDIENNDIARILFSTLAKNICFVANRILNENPSIMTITEKELNVIIAIINNKDDAEAAKHIGTSTASLRGVISRTMHKLGAQNRVEMIAKAFNLPVVE
jgi:DNA-binding CsgD family transcriptional regulator